MWGRRDDSTEVFSVWGVMQAEREEEKEGRWEVGEIPQQSLC